MIQKIGTTLFIRCKEDTVASVSRKAKSETHQSNFFDFSLLQAKELITRIWKKVDPPTAGAGVNVMALCMGMEKITYIN